MLLIIDIGNSLVKYHFNRQTFFEIDDLASAISASLHQYSGSIGIDTFRVFIVSTRKSLNAIEKDKTKVLLQNLQKQYALWFPIEFNEELLEQKKLLKDIYRELGDDRQIKVLGALKMFENMNIALFDFGSATTLTLVNSKYQFKSGLIDLGFLKSFELLGSGMDQLPELTHKRIDSYYFDLESRSEGNYTHTELAILNGIYSRVLGTISEWNKYAETLMQEPYTVLVILLGILIVLRMMLRSLKLLLASGGLALSLASPQAELGSPSFAILNPSPPLAWRWVGEEFVGGVFVLLCLG
jgi:pantothenate kinase type III